MPYRKKAYPRRGRKKAPWYKKKYNAFQLAQKAAQGVYYLKGLVNSEKHYRDDTYELGTNRSIVHTLNDIPIGDGNDQRTGNSILARSLYIRGHMEINGAVLENTRVALLIVQDTQQVSDTVPSVTDILSTDNPDSMLKLHNAGRFKIISRKNYTLLPRSAGSQNAISFHKFFKLYHHIRWNGSAGTDIQKGGYYLVIVSSENSDFPDVTVNTRLGFYDN